MDKDDAVSPVTACFDRVENLIPGMDPRVSDAFDIVLGSHRFTLGPVGRRKKVSS